MLNPAGLTLLIIGLGLELAFIKSVSLNCLLAGCCLLYLLCYRRVKLTTIALLLLVTLPLALGSWWSFLAFGRTDNWHNAWIYGSRIYAYLLLGASLTLTNSVEDILFNLHVHLKLPATFVYGLLAAFNLLTSIKNQFATIRYSAQIRGRNYHLWQPGLYLRIILVALKWSADLAQAMTAQGFSEGYPRTRPTAKPFPKWQFCFIGLCLISYAWGGISGSWW